MKIKRYIGIGLVVLVVVVGVAYARFNRQAKAEPLRLMTLYELADINFTLDYARDNGFYEKHNVDVQNVDVQNSSNVTKVLLSGVGDVVAIGATSPLQAYLNGADTKVLGNLYSPFSYVIVSKYPKDESNKIKNIAVSGVANEPNLIGMLALKSLGVDPNKVKFINASSFDSAKIELFDSGSVDSMIIIDKFVPSIKSSHYVFELQGVTREGGLTRSIVTTSKTLSSKNAQIKSFVAAIYDAVQDMRSNPDKAIKYAETKYGMDDEKANAFYKKFKEAAVEFKPSVGFYAKLKNLIVEKMKPSDPNRPIDAFVEASMVP